MMWWLWLLIAGLLIVGVWGLAKWLEAKIKDELPKDGEL